MGFNSKQLKDLDNAYRSLGTEEALVAHKEELSKLTSEEQNNLAMQLTLDCPEEELSDLAQVAARCALPTEGQSDANPIEGNSAESEEEPFHEILTVAIDLRQRLCELMNPENEAPHDLLLDDVVSEHAHKFQTLCSKATTGNEKEIAIRLALSTPKEQIKTLGTTIRSAFPAVLGTELRCALTLRREIERLLSANPVSFFTSREFNLQLCFKYAELFSVLDGKESFIAENFAKATTLEKQPEVIASLKSLFPYSILLREVEQKFKQNAAVKINTNESNSPREQQPAIATDPNRLFAHPAIRPENTTGQESTPALGSRY